MKINVKRRFPKVLWDEVTVALRAVDDLGNETSMELLARYRRNRAKCIATWDVLNIGAPVDGLEFMSFRQLLKIEQLNKAFQKLHHYQNGGAGDYVAADVESAINSIRAQGPRKPKNNYDEICRWLRRIGYEASHNKKALVDDAIAAFGVKNSTIRTALREGGMTKKYQRKKLL
jgi:hypothetical protein